MKPLDFSDGNITDLIAARYIDYRTDVNHRLQIHSSLIQRLSLEKELEGHQGCVNTLSWNSKGSLLISGSDDERINIWSYTSKKLLRSIDTGHSANIFCTKFIPETSDDLVVSGAGDAEVRLFRLSRFSGRRPEESASEPLAIFHCHSRRVKKLAVEDGNPNVVWSASEDGTLRQHDFREGASCPPAGSSHQDCRNVLIDLRSGAKKSLAEPPKQSLALKSCDISSTRPHQLLVGGSDAFGRLYDRRMLPPLSSSETRMKPPPCVNYFCPIHLSDHGHSSLHLTHVTFSPNGEEVLLSYSGEHVYLMDVDTDEESGIRYRSSDVPRLLFLAPVPDGTGISVRPQLLPDDFTKSRKVSNRLKKCNELVQAAEKSLKDGTSYIDAIEACTEVLDGKGPEIGAELRHKCLCTRAALFLKRQWKNDVHMAIRDCYKARSINPLSFDAHINMSEALLQLGKDKEAFDYALVAQRLAPLNSEVLERVATLREHLSAAEAEKCFKESDGISKPEEQSGRAKSLSELIYRSEENGDASVGEPRSDREDSDYDEEMELDFETSISGDEGRDVESGILRVSLNLRFHRRRESARERCSTNGSCGSPSSYLNEGFQEEVAFDMKQRYVGHCNLGTDIKQASFLGQKGEFVASGSDDGRWFIWEKRTGRLIKMLSGDEAVVNCVQCHPFDCAIATSGIDDTIKIWTPRAHVPSLVAGGTVGPEIDVLTAMENNQHKMSRSRGTIMPLELLERFRMQDFAEGSLHPF